MNDDERDGGASEREAILRRRARFVASAIAGLTLPVATADCDPRPCLDMSVPEPTTSEQPSASAALPPAESAAPTTSAGSANPPKAGELLVDVATAKKLGLPAIGFRAMMSKGGWSISEPSKTAYVQASGPPGGPQTFLVKPYNDGVSDQAALEVLFKKALSDWSGLDPIVAGPAETVSLGGKKLEAQSFRTGKSLATTVWCVVKLPEAPGARTGALFLFGGGARESDKPTCKAALDGAALGEIVSTLTFL